MKGTIIAFTLLLLLWALVVKVTGVSEAVFPSPLSVAAGFVEELKSGQLLLDLWASIFRVGFGFLLGALLAIPCGLVLGSFARVRMIMLPLVNFFRSLSSIAWIPFAVLWFGIGDAPVIFLIFMATFFPVALATAAAVVSIPQTYFQVASDYQIHGIKRMLTVVFWAVLPQVITALRMASGVAWVTVVAAEMLAGKGGLGFAIQDARNGLRTDLLMVEMIVIGVIGVLIDRILLQLTRHQKLRWGYEQ